MRPEAKIAITFHTRSLKKQFKDLIENFCYSKASKQPDWSKIKIIHAWGSEKE
jgi:superfamily I DNA and RNA helicase